MREPYVPQGAHQRFLIDARLFLGKNFPSPPLPVWRAVLYTRPKAGASNGDLWMVEVAYGPNGLEGAAFPQHVVASKLNRVLRSPIR